MTRRQIVGIGVPTIDRLIQIPGAPSFGAGLEVRALGIDGGGPVPTALVAARRLGHPAALITRLGEDEGGDLILAGLRREAIDTSLIQRSATTRSASSVILVDRQGERAILNDPGAVTDPELAEPEFAAIRNAPALLLNRSSPAAVTGARVAREAGVLVELDAGGVDDRIMDLVALSDIVIASTYHAEVRGLSPEHAVEELIAAGVAIAIVTLGERGSLGRTAEGALARVPAYPVTPVDTTGAGDVYHGAFTVAHLDGAPLEAAMRFAAVAAALTCTAAGGRAGIPNRATADRTLAAWRP